MKKIEHLKPTTQRSYIIVAICSILKVFDKEEKLYNEYFNILSTFNSQLKVNTTKSEAQEKAWIEPDKIDTIYNNLKSKVSKKISNKKEYDTLLDYVLLSLYYLQAPRRNNDYALMKISSDKSDKKFNYLDMKNKQFIFNNYKTQKTYSEMKVDISDELYKVLKFYLSKHPQKNLLKNKNYSINLLVDASGEPYNKSNMITKLLNKIFEAKVGVSMLRNIYLTSKYGKVMKELDNDVKSMATSKDVALDHYIKKDK
jgi:integrase